MSVVTPDPKSIPDRVPAPRSDTASSSDQGSRGAALRGSLSTAAVIVVLSALAAWGFFSDWKLPKFSELTGGGADAAEPWCSEHNVPQQACIECKPELLPGLPDYGWCKTHGVNQCPFEHPEVAQLAEPYLVPPNAAERAHQALLLRKRPENAGICKLYLRRIQFASNEALAKAGVDVDITVQQPITEAVMANGELTYDERSTAHLSSRVSGTVAQVIGQLGDDVEPGDVLALIDSTEVGRAKAELLSSIIDLRLQRTTVSKLEPLTANGTINERQLREATAAMQAAEVRALGAQQSLANLGLQIELSDLEDLSTVEMADRIRLLGLPPELVASMGSQITTSNLFPLRASLPGRIVAMNVVAGEVVDPTAALYTVADVSEMWLMLDVRQEDAPLVKIGQKVEFRPSDGTADVVDGKVVWVSTAADEQTRTLKVRVDVANQEARLKANTFGTGKIILREEPAAVVVSNDAVHWDGHCNVVFVRDKNWFQPGAPQFFHVREIRTGVVEDGKTEIIAGLAPGEVVATTNSMVLESQLLKSSLGEGCGCAH